MSINPHNIPLLAMTKDFELLIKSQIISVNWRKRKEKRLVLKGRRGKGRRERRGKGRRERGGIRGGIRGGE